MAERVEEKQLELVLKESLEKDITSILSECKGITIREAMDIYYRSELSRQIDKGIYGIQYLDATYLIDDLLENEKSLFD
jgi:hypothetical protein